MPLAFFIQKLTKLPELQLDLSNFGLFCMLLAINPIQKDNN